MATAGRKSREMEEHMVLWTNKAGDDWGQADYNSTDGMGNMIDYPWADEGYDCTAHAYASQDDSAPIEVPVPEWADMDEGYKPMSATKFGKDSHCVVVKYAPNGTMGVGYSRAFRVDEGTNRPVAWMEGIWSELHKRNKDMPKCAKSNWIGVPLPLAKGGHLPSGVSISMSGKVSTAFGAPNNEDSLGVVRELESIYMDWSRFPNAKDYSMVERLDKALRTVHRMKVEAEEYEREIADVRQAIRERQEHIATLESRMNKVYEDAADAMNLLEENGVDPESPIDLGVDGSMFPDITIPCEISTNSGVSTVNNITGISAVNNVIGRYATLYDASATSIGTGI